MEPAKKKRYKERSAENGDDCSRNFNKCTIYDLQLWMRRKFSDMIISCLLGNIIAQIKDRFCPSFEGFATGSK
jgi:hypothetical protein